MVDLSGLVPLGQAVHVVSYFVHEDDVVIGDRLETRQPERIFGIFGLFWCHSRMTTGSFLCLEVQPKLCAQEDPVLRIGKIAGKDGMEGLL